MRIEEVHIHTPFQLTDHWSSDAALRQAVTRIILSSPKGPEHLPAILSALKNFSQNVEKEARPFAELCDRPNVAPRLVQYDEWGQRVDRVETSEGWRRLTEWSTRNGIIGEGYSKAGQEKYLTSNESLGGRETLGELARLFSFTRAFIFAPDSRVNLCPTSMQDGAVRTLELYGTNQQKEKYLPKLLSRDINTAWQAGQWMTERIGGSDVGMTETVAHPLVPLKNGQKGKAGDLYSVHGFKWFSSAADGHVSLALARTNPDRALGSKGLSLFLIPLHKKDRPHLPQGADYKDETAPSSPFNGIQVHRLKSKLGTVHVPTAELELCGAIGELVGEEGRGVAQIAQVLNITRVYSANGTVSGIGRALQIVESYSQKRAVGVMGRSTLLKDIPMHSDRIARVAVTYRALIQLLFFNTLLLGKSEAGTSTARESRRLRLLTPISKAFGAYRATECVAQCIEAMGGQGYMSENPLTQILRDGMVERIWEGTPSVLSLDVARVHAQSQGQAVSEWIVDCNRSIEETSTALARVDEVKAKIAADTLKETLQELTSAYLDEGALMPTRGGTMDGRYSRMLLDLIGIVTCGTLLLEQTAWSFSSESGLAERGEPAFELEVASRWIDGSEGGLSVARKELANLRRGVKAEVWDNRLAFGLGHESPSPSKL